MTPTHKWITVALFLMTVYNTAGASRNQETTDNRLRSLVQSTERLEQKNVALSVSVHQNGAVINHAGKQGPSQAHNSRAFILPSTH